MLICSVMTVKRCGGESKMHSGERQLIIGSAPGFHGVCVSEYTVCVSECVLV